MKYRFPILSYSICTTMLTLASPCQAQLLNAYLDQSYTSPPQSQAINLGSKDEAFDAHNTQHQDLKTANNMARGVLKATQTASIAARLSARITELPYRDGQYFEQGSLLVKFDCSGERAELEALQHSHIALSVKYENVLELYQAGAAGQLEESMARAEKARAAADIKVLETRLTECEIYAPFSGYVQMRHVSEHDTPAAGTPLISLIKAGRPEISLIAPSAWLRWLKTGTHFTFTIDETGNTHRAKITRFGASVDPVSQTIDITAHFTSSARGALSGMSGVAQFETPQP